MDRLILSCLLVFSVAAPLSAQCQLDWLPGLGIAGTNREVYASVRWDPDGAGPQPELVVIGGRFEVAGDVRGGVVAYDPLTQEWTSFGGESDGIIYALLPMPNGDLIAAGQFSQIGGALAPNIARFDGTSWSSLGAGVDATVVSLASLPNGDLAVGGWFTQAGSVAATGIARWDGAAWSALAPNFVGDVYHMVQLPSGDLVVAGFFSAIGGVAAPGLARFDGASWSAPASSITTTSGVTGQVADLLVLGNGDLLVFGLFAFVDGVPAANAARFDGTSWSAFGAGLAPAGIQASAELPSGDVVVCNNTQVVGGAVELHSFDGATWATLGSGIRRTVFSSPFVHDLLASPNGDLLAFGRFGNAGGMPAANAARWDGGAWSWLSPGCDQMVEALHVLPNGDLVAGGAFTAIGGIAASGVARFDGQSWSAIGGGVDGFVADATTTPSGDLVVCGDFDTAGGAVARRIARWDGTQWFQLSSGINGFGASGRAVAALPNGDIVVAGAFPQVGGVPASHIARWDGATWHAMGGSVNFAVNALEVLPSGDLVAAGLFTIAGGIAANGVARWDGAAWHPMGAGLVGSVDSLALSPDGQLFAGHGYVGQGWVSRWDGASWQPVGATFDYSPAALAFLPDGSLLASGGFEQVGAAVAAGLARWDGTAWNAIAPGMDRPDGRALAALPNGDIVVGGRFVSAGAPGNSYIAHVRPTCPATAVVDGSGCVGPAGPLALGVDRLPWVGSTFRSTATGLPPGSLAVEVRGLGALATPLSSILPQGLPGCDLLVTPDMTTLLVPLGGEASVDVPLPVSPALVAQTFRQQVVVVGLGPALASLSSTNALVVTIGTF